MHELLEAYAPPSILVNDRHEAVHLFGNVQPFIRMRDGLASLDLNRILAEPLVPVVSALPYKVAKDGTPLVSSPLAATRESLQATIEELETANEELQATNEELMASNEELQSSNEELQSVNEELNTVNAE